MTTQNENSNWKKNQARLLNADRKKRANGIQPKLEIYFIEIKCNEWKRKQQQLFNMHI